MESNAQELRAHLWPAHPGRPATPSASASGQVPCCVAVRGRAVGGGGAALAGSRLPSHLPGGLRLVHSCMALARSRVKWESWQQEKEGGCPTELSGSVAGA